MFRSPHLFAIILAFAAGSSSQGQASAYPPAPIVRAASFAERLVRSQNSERERIGLPDLSWDPTLAVNAGLYAQELAATGKWQHSPQESRQGQGENLWMGTHASFTLEEMVGDWLAERRTFHRGVFPNVTTIGSWHEVGHYTQIIWPQTLRVGCSVSATADFDYLVCRYAQPGNVMGEVVGPVSVASR